MSYQPLQDIEKHQTKSRSDLEDDGPQPSAPKRSTREWLTIFTSIAICSLMSFVLGTWTSSSHHTELASDGRLAPSGNIETHWTYNYTFSREPNPISEAAWGSLPPIGGAFIKHPDYPREMNVAMYHQLHCLHGLRIAYYLELAKNNETLAGMMEDVKSKWGDHDAAHTIHCFDYLKNALLCAADTNLEPINEETGHVDAWGTTRMCRDRNVIDDWAYKWRSGNRTGIV